MGVVIILSLAAIPLGVLISFLRDRSLRRRSRFGLRLAGFVISMAIPWMIELPSAISQQGSLTLVWIGLGWGLLLVALAPSLLFRTALEPGSYDDGPDPGSEDDPRPQDPIGGTPLPDAEQSANRVRGPHPRRHAARPRRRAREPEHRPRAPSQAKL